MVACDGNCASLKPSEVALMLLCSYLDASVNRLMTANTEATVSNLSHNVPISPPYQRLKDELTQFAAKLREKCNVSIRTKFFFCIFKLIIYFFTIILFIIYFFIIILFIIYLFFYICIRLLII